MLILEKEQGEDNPDANEKPTLKKATTISKLSDNADRQVTAEAKQEKMTADPQGKNNNY